MSADRGANVEEDIALGCFEEGIITSVEPYSDGNGWSVGYGDCWGCGVRDVGVEPKIGDHLRTFGRFGRPFHGQALNGVVLWYLTVEEQEVEHKAMVERMDAERRAQFEENREQLDRDYDSLSPLFKMRIDRFRNANPDFRWESEPYEMFVCTQAVVLGEWALGQTDDKDAAVALIDEWNAINSAEHDPPYDYKTQHEMVPGWADGHSGNTHGCAVMLAKEHVRGSERVPLHMGALAPLVGTADYSKPVS